MRKFNLSFKKRKPPLRELPGPVVKNLLATKKLYLTGSKISGELWDYRQARSFKKRCDVHYGEYQFGRLNIFTTGHMAYVGKHSFVDYAFHTKMMCYQVPMENILYTSPNSTLFSMFNHSAIVISLLDELDLTGLDMLDLGSGDGIHGVFAKKNGANKILSFDPGVEKDGIKSDALWGSPYKQNITYNLSTPEERDSIRFFASDFRDAHSHEAILQHGNQVIVANIGPYYGSAHLDAIEMAGQLPKVKYFIAGGYVFPQRNQTLKVPWSTQFYPGEAIAKLLNCGFGIVKSVVMFQSLEESNVAIYPPTMVILAEKR